MDYFELGYLGLFLATFLAATILPFSSEGMVVGMLALDYSCSSVLIIATLGNWLGGLTCYAIGYLGKWDWITSILKVDKKRLDNVQQWLKKYGTPVAFFCWVPFIGDIIAIGLGLAKVSFYASSIWMLVGKGIRYAAVIALFEMV